MSQPVSNSSRMLGAIALRVAIDLLIWLPMWLILTIQMQPMGKLGVLAAELGCILLGLWLGKLPPLWRRLSLITVFLGLAVLGTYLYTGGLTMILFLWLGVLLWRGRFLRLEYWHYALAFAVSCVGVIATSQNEDWASYRQACILMAVIWVVVWFISLNRNLVDSAGHHGGIVTSPVRRSSRKYLTVFLAVSVVLIALTASYGQQLLTPKISIPDTNWMDMPPIEPPRTVAEEPEWSEFFEEKGEPWLIWDILFWVMAAVTIIGAILLARAAWKNRIWTWRALIGAVRNWFFRERPVETVPFIEERRSLQKNKKKTSLLESLFRGHNRERKPNWAELSNPEKVRRVYQEVVEAGIEQGYEFKSHHTPSETLAGIEQWQRSRKLPDNEKKSSYWTWLLSMRLSLVKLYERVRYSPHEVSDQDVESLEANAPSRARPR